LSLPLFARERLLHLLILRSTEKIPCPSETRVLRAPKEPAQSGIDASGNKLPLPNVSKLDGIVLLLRPCLPHSLRREKRPSRKACTLMKQLFSIFPAALMFAGLVHGQSSTPSREDTSGSTSGPQSTSPASRSYSSEGYRRAEVFVTGYGLTTSSATGNSITHEATAAGGGAAGYRFQLNAWSALEGRYGYSRNSQKYTINGAVASIPTYLAEVTGSYVYRLPGLRGFQPFLEGGGGIVHFSPGDYGNGSNSAGGNSGGGGGGIGGPYASANPGLNSQTRPAFVYGVGGDFFLSSRFSIRLEYRGLALKSPDFNQTGLQTNAFSFLSQPSIGVAYRF